MEVSYEIMGQQEVINFLKKQKEPLTGGEIAKGMHERAEKISRFLTKLVKNNEIKYKELDRNEAFRRCGIHRWVKIYYI